MRVQPVRVREYKQRALDEGRSMQAVVDDALAQYLARPATPAGLAVDRQVSVPRQPSSHVPARRKQASAPLGIEPGVMPASVSSALCERCQHPETSHWVSSATKARGCVAGCTCVRFRPSSPGRALSPTA